MQTDNGFVILVPFIFDFLIFLFMCSFPPFPLLSETWGGERESFRFFIQGGGDFHYDVCI